MRKYRLRALLTAAALMTTGVVVTAPSPAAADLTDDCGLACPVGTVSGTGTFPMPGTTGPFSLSLTGEAASLRNIVGGDPSLVPITVQVSGFWQTGCGSGGSNPLLPILVLLGPALAVVRTVARAIDLGTGCGQATVNGSQLGFTIVGVPSLALVLVARDGIREVAVIALLGSPSGYNGVISNVNLNAGAL